LMTKRALEFRLLYKLPHIRHSVKGKEQVKSIQQQLNRWIIT